MPEPKPTTESGITSQPRGHNPTGIADPDYNSQDQFDQMQKKLVPLWKSIESFNQDPQTIVVVPSMSVDLAGAGAVVQAYEERFLFLLLLLRQPRARMVYVTSQTILPTIIDYYLDLLPGVIPSHARQRLFLISPLDASVRPLSQKLLERPRLIERIRSLISDPDRAHLVPFNTTNREKELALRLGIPMYGADPIFFPLGTKSGCRKIFVEEDVPHPLGYENLASKDDLIEAIAEMRSRKPSIKQVLVKLNEGVSGEGNALVDLTGLPASGDSKEEAALEERLKAMQFELSGITYESYMRKLEERKGIVEERIAGEEFRSPSVQLRVTPLGVVELLSTHDQKINLRKGGTTHPFLTLQFLTDGKYDPETAIFTAPGGQQKFFVASDHVESPLYRTLTPDDLFDIVVRHNLHFNQTRQTGVVFHMMSALGELGRTGLTAVGNSHEEARATYAQAVAVLDDEARSESIQ